MQVKDICNKYDKHLLDVNFDKALVDENFKILVKKLNLPTEILKKYTSVLQDASKELNNCLKCRGLDECKNCVAGCLYKPIVANDRISFVYQKCNFQEEYDKKFNYLNNIWVYNMPSYIKESSFKTIFIDDKNRIELIKYIKNYFDNYFNKKIKSLFVCGNFGSGKTYIISALFNELAKKGIKSAIVYFPEFLRSLKSGFDDNSYNEKFDYIKKVPLLLIDDIGAETVTAWSRDEILGSIMQYRMEENLPTFFTSNLTLDELEVHLSMSGNKVDKVKARRIIERIKYLADEIKLVSIDRRK